MAKERQRQAAQMRAAGKKAAERQAAAERETRALRVAQKQARVAAAEEQAAREDERRQKALRAVEERASLEVEIASAEATAKKQEAQMEVARVSAQEAEAKAEAAEKQLAAERRLAAAEEERLRAVAAEEKLRLEAEEERRQLAAEAAVEAAQPEPEPEPEPEAEEEWHPPEPEILRQPGSSEDGESEYEDGSDDDPAWEEAKRAAELEERRLSSGSSNLRQAMETRRLSLEKETADKEQGRVDAQEEMRMEAQRRRVSAVATRKSAAAAEAQLEPKSAWGAEPEPEPELEREPEPEPEAAWQAEANVLAPAEREAFVCVLRSLVRAGCELSSPLCKGVFLTVGEEVQALEARDTQDGVPRVRIDKGWVSRFSKAGRLILMPREEFEQKAGDIDGDGLISVDEFVVWHLHALGLAPCADDYALFYAADTDGDGVISQEEFRACQPLFLDNDTRGEKQSRDREQLNDMLRAAAMPPAQEAV